MPAVARDVVVDGCWRDFRVLGVRMYFEIERNESDGEAEAGEGASGSGVQWMATKGELTLIWKPARTRSSADCAGSDLSLCFRRSWLSQASSTGTPRRPWWSASLCH